MARLVSWCHENRYYPLPKRYICTDDDNSLYGISVDLHNYVFKTRIEGKSRKPVMLACAQYCGYDPYLVRTVANFSFTDETQEVVDSVVYCQCPNVAASPSETPPTPGRLRLEAHKYQNWNEIADADRECSGRRLNISVEEHNKKLLGKRCSDGVPTAHMECEEGTIDHCSAFLGPDDIGAMPWTHRCEAYPFR